MRHLRVLAQKRRRALAVHALLASTILSTAAAAQDSAPAAATAKAAPADNRAQADDIIVTATKRSEYLQDVPISLQALGQVKLEQHQVTKLDDYINLLPSVSFQSYGPGQSQVFFRGISTGGDGGYGYRQGSLPASGLYIDEVPLTTIGNTPDFHVYDISRVEALSGPQGTLFGASSMAGTLRLITNQPDPKRFSAGYDLQIDKFGKGKPGGVAEGFVNLPLSDRIALRVVGFYDYEGGYIDNVPSTRTYTAGDDDPSNDLTVNNSRYVKKDFNDVETYGGRAALKIDLDDNWTVTPSIIYQHQVANGAFLYDPAEGDLKVNDFTRDINKDEWYQAALTVTGKVGNFDLVYAGGYFGRSVFNQADYSYYTVAYDYYAIPDGKGGLLDPSQVYQGYDRFTKQTHELRLTSPSDSRFRALVGAFYQRQTDHTISAFAIPGLAAVQPADPTPVPDISSHHVPLLQDGVYAGNQDIIDRDVAIFSELSYDILPNLTLTGGIRGYYYRNTRYGFAGSIRQTDSATCVPTTRKNIPCISADYQAHDYGETHKANLSWKIDPDHLLYFTYSTGFRPGGFSSRSTIPPYKADTLSNFEIGWKTSWLSHRLTVNGAIFLEEWHDLQYGISLIGGQGVVSIFNVGDARVKGMEGDITFRPTRNLTLSTSATYIDSKLTTGFSSYDSAGNPEDTAPAGTRLPIQPRFKMNATARYEFNVGDLKSFVQAGMLHQSGTRTWLTDNEYSYLGPTRPFTTFDFSVGVSHGNWSLEAFMQNAFDKRGQLSINTVCVPSICGFRPRIYPVKPQFFGLKMGQKF